MNWLLRSCLLLSSFVILALLSAACQPTVGSQQADTTPPGVTSTLAERPTTAGDAATAAFSTNTPQIDVTPSPEPEEPTAEPEGSALDGVELILSQNSYRAGEEVRFTIYNNLDSDIFYLYGCSRPQVYKIEGDQQIPIVVSITEDIPSISSLAPQENHKCVWDQMAWQDPNAEGQARYRNYLDLLPVPHGEYQLRLEYYHHPQDAEFNENPQTTWSEPFFIR